MVGFERAKMEGILGKHLSKRKPEIIKNKTTIAILETMIKKINENILQL